MFSLTANELKRGGVSTLKQAMQNANEHQIAIDVRGKPEFVVLDMNNIMPLENTSLIKPSRKLKQIMPMVIMMLLMTLINWPKTYIKQAANRA